MKRAKHFLKIAFNLAKRFEAIGWGIIFAASLVFLWFTILAGYYEVTANREPPIQVGRIVVGEGNVVSPGTEVFAYIPMKWDEKRNCSAEVEISIRGEAGEIYPSPPSINYSADTVKRLIKINPERFEFYINIPAIARVGKAYAIGSGTYICDDNKSFFDRRITLSYIDSFTIAGH